MEKQKDSRCGGKGSRMAAKIGRGIFMGLAFALVFGVFVRMLWNWLLPGIFGVHEITYFQAIGMIVLTRILFGIRGMRPGFPHHSGGHGHWGCSHEGDANGHIRDWHQYDAWWEAEGRESFRKYIENREK